MEGELNCSKETMRQCSKEDGFPENKRLSLSELQVLECANEPWAYELVEDKVEMKKDQMEQECIKADIPCIDLSADEVSVIDLSSDEEDQVYSKALEHCSGVKPQAPEYRLTAIQRIQLALLQKSPAIIETPPLTTEQDNKPPMRSPRKRTKSRRVRHDSKEQNEVGTHTPSQRQISSENFEKSTNKMMYVRKRRKKADCSSILPQSTPEKNLHCNHCSEVFLEKFKLATHLKEAHFDKRPHTCELCGWSFAQKNKLALHRITHTIDRPHKCKQCEDSFNRKYSLERHVRIKHLKTPRISEAAENKPCQRKPASCPYCQERFENKDVLKMHLQHKHKEKRPYLCTQCNWPFSRRKHLVAHMKTHSNDKPFSCVICDDVSFNRRFSLERHTEHVHGVRIRLTPEETPVGEEYCPECQSVFGSMDCPKLAYSLCGHVICMDCVKRAEELGCGQCTTENAPQEAVVEEMDGPVKSPVKDLEEMETADKATEKPMAGKKNVVAKLTIVKSPKEKRKKFYMCKYCHEEFPEKPDLGIHLQYIHRNLRPFSCVVCQWAFSSMRDLERHQVTHKKQSTLKRNKYPANLNRKSTMNTHVNKFHSIGLTT